MFKETIDVPGPDRIYRNYLEAGEIRIQRCKASSEYFFPPRLISPRNRSRDWEWVEISGCGVIYSASVVRRKPERGGDYSIVLVDLDEGVRMMSTMTDVASAEVAIGQRVHLGIGDFDGEKAVVLKIAKHDGEAS
ncbi:MAG: hypothetical protein CBC12_04040 [Candidatus Puniceispirillum sp. TMED52]|nr:MAG: hypothetical protein CBC12_04040 [Candidatus Puniceispirillum sp. TMED52]|tara:strand:+ start:146 stop:550 length:405 start_codon:yes stop_codon:yes gene_type:complete